jgi:hypothetical protein
LKNHSLIMTLWLLRYSRTRRGFGCKKQVIPKSKSHYYLDNHLLFLRENYPLMKFLQISNNRRKMQPSQRLSYSSKINQFRLKEFRKLYLSHFNKADLRLSGYLKQNHCLRYMDKNLAMFSK